MPDSNDVARNFVVALQSSEPDAIAFCDLRQRLSTADHVTDRTLPHWWRMHRNVASRWRIRTEIVDDAVVNRPREVRLESRTQIVFEFYDAEERKLLGEAWHKRCKVVQVRGAPTKHVVAMTTKGTGFELRQPGTFQVEFAELDGYEQIRDQIVEVGKGELEVVRIALRRSR